MPRLLTVRKEAWANKFKPDILRGEVLNPNMAIAARYQAQLEELIRSMSQDVQRALIWLFNGEPAEEFFAEDASIASQARILTNALQKKWEKLFANSASWIAESFAKQADAASSKAVHMSIKRLSGGLSLSTASLQGPLEDILKATIAENVALIKSIPQKYLNGVQGAVMRSITTGEGMKTLQPYLADGKGITERRARMIALDQTRKAYNGLSKGRMQNLGITEYEWMHSGGSNHPRKEHIKMSGNIYKFSEPPIIDSRTGERGIPGQLPNCRCRMRPIISFEAAEDGRGHHTGTAASHAPKAGA